MNKEIKNNKPTDNDIDRSLVAFKTGIINYRQVCAFLGLENWDEVVEKMMVAYKIDVITLTELKTYLEL